MEFELSEKVRALRERVVTFMDERVYPAEREVAAFVERTAGLEVAPVIEDLKRIAREAGLWNLWMSDPEYGPGLSNLEYAPLCEVMGRSLIGPEIFNCSFPDTGNMEVLALFGSEDQKQRWLHPLLMGEIRSAFALTEPDVASSDPTNIRSTISRDGDDYLVNGHKWYISGASDPRCELYLFFGLSDAGAPRHARHSLVLVPASASGVEVVRNMRVLGFDDAPSGHAEVRFDHVRIPATNIVLGEGRGFEIIQARLGPGRIHHCMRAVGMCERALELMTDRALTRTAFGQRLADMGVVRHEIAESRIEIEQLRLLTLHTAWIVDRIGGRAARSQLAQLKVAAANTGQRVLDRAIQVHGAAGLSQDLPLAQIYAGMRALRFGDGPDEVHRETIAKLELKARTEHADMTRPHPS
jgi:acyl-CoA dehydrogenase